MLEWAIIPTCGVLNRLRGSEYGKPYTSKYIVSALWGVIFGIYTLDAWVGLIVACGMAFWSAFGWGDYFDFSKKKNAEVRPIDYLMSKFFVPGALCDVVSMSLRGLFIYPLFCALAAYSAALAPLAIGLLGVLQGPIYYIWHLIDEDDLCGIKTAASEVCVGVLFSMLLLWGL